MFPVPDNTPGRLPMGIRALLGSGAVALFVTFFLTGLMDPDTTRTRILFFIAWLVGTLALSVSEYVTKQDRLPRWMLRFTAGGLIALAFFGFDSVLVEHKEADLLPITFKESPEFTPHRKAAIRHALLEFRTYLRGIEFPIHDQMPHIGITKESRLPNGVPSHFQGISYGPINYKSLMTVGREDASDTIAFVRVYAMYEVNTNLTGTVHDSLARAILETSLAKYIFSSYTGKYDTTYQDLWADVFWDIRSSITQTFADELAVYTIKAFQDGPAPPPSSTSGTVKPIPANTPEGNDEIYDRLQDALGVVGNEDHLVIIDSIIKKHGLLLSKPLRN